MLARAFVNVRVAPGIGRNIALHVRAFPTGGVARLLHEILQTVLSFWIISIVHFERIERGAERSNLRLGRGQTRLFGPSRKFRDHDRRENSENDQDQEQLDQRESASLGRTAASAVPRGASPRE